MVFGQLALSDIDVWHSGIIIKQLTSYFKVSYNRTYTICKKYRKYRNCCFLTILKKWFLTLIVAGFLKSVLHYTKTGFISNYTKQIGFMAKYYKPQEFSRMYSYPLKSGMSRAVQKSKELLCKSKLNYRKMTLKIRLPTYVGKSRLNRPSNIRVSTSSNGPEKKKKYFITNFLTAFLVD